MSESLFDRVLAAAAEAAVDVPAAAEVERRLQGPIAVALAGRINAGKSTLLNALLGERLALTDATECTRLVCRYSFGRVYSAAFVSPDLSMRPVAFVREEQGLQIPEAGVPTSSTLSITAPNSALRTMTLIDTPGLGSEDTDRAAATAGALGTAGSGAPEADAVVYLLRHAHRTDVDTLEALRDRWAGNGSAFNVIAVLSRADEIGSGRPDAMESASRIAERYVEDGRLRGLATTVLPISGLLAETGSTLLQEEFAWLRLVASGPKAQVDRSLLATGLFLNASDSPLTVEVRRRLLARFGLFGLRSAVEKLRDGSVTDSTALAREMLNVSGLERLKLEIAERFGRRAKDLQAVNALEALAAAGRGMDPPPAWLARLEAISASSYEVAEMMALQAATDGLLDLSDSDVRRLTILLAGNGAGQRLGLAGTASTASQKEAALQAIGHWRELSANPLAGRLTSQVCETAARAAERIYADVASA